MVYHTLPVVFLALPLLSWAMPVETRDASSDLDLITQRRLSTIVGGVTGATSIANWYFVIMITYGLVLTSLSGFRLWVPMASGLIARSIILPAVMPNNPTGLRKNTGSVSVRV